MNHDFISLLPLVSLQVREERKVKGEAIASTFLTSLFSTFCFAGCTSIKILDFDLFCGNLPA